jgi:sialate O-acetylesterase
MRAVQLAAAEADPNVALVSIIDIGDPTDIHPTNKQEVAARVQLATEVLAYGRAAVSGLPPRPSQISFSDGQALVRWEPVGVKMEQRGSHSVLLAGADRVFHPAEIVVDGDQLRATATAVPEPVAIRYAWGDNPLTGLYSQTGLAASPFRSDDWDRDQVVYSPAALSSLQAGTQQP